MCIQDINMFIAKINTKMSIRIYLLNYNNLNLFDEIKRK